MGMPISFLARGPAAHSPAAAEAVRAVQAELTGVDHMFSTYRPDSEVSRLGRGELTLVDSSAEVRDVSDLCAAATTLTGGLFQAVRPDGRWDPSGLVKGWAAERAMRLLTQVAGVDWCLNAGGDVAVWSPSGQHFTVGIQDPRDAQRIAAAVRVGAGGLATSGRAARGDHVYDPRSGLAAVASASVTVVGPSLEQADVLATAAFVAGDGALAFVAGIEGYQALHIAVDGAVTTTTGWPVG